MSELIASMEESTDYNMFFFGCWNRDGCMIDNSPLNQVVHMIQTNNREKKYDRGIIAGDNSYPNKKEEILNYGTIKNISVKIKKHYPDIVNNGINCINLIGVPLWGIIGNHDMEQSFNGECVALSHQLKKNFIEPLNFYTKSHKNSFFIFIDTNILNVLYANKVMEECYTMEETKFITTKKDVDLFFSNCLNTYNEHQYHHIFVIAHEPMITVKMKEGVAPIIVAPWKKYLMDRFATFNTVINYLCADTHNYQYIEIQTPRYLIRQIISGTGGAKLDDIGDMKMPHIYMTDEIKYEWRDIIKNYGYTDIQITGRNVEFTFIPLGQPYEKSIENAYRKSLEQLYNGLDTTSNDNQFSIVYLSYLMKKYKNIKKKYLKLYDSSSGIVS